jgi:hypothetical protein
MIVFVRPLLAGPGSTDRGRLPITDRHESLCKAGHRGDRDPRGVATRGGSISTSKARLS